jgi:energy-coupling factor transporter ATP-binding protein EcfA2
MVDWLFVWGVTQAVGFTFQPILEELAKDSAKDFTKDFFKDCLKKVLKLPSKEPLDIAAGKALKEFLQLVQQELEDADLNEKQIKGYIKPFKLFIKNPSVTEILGSPFVENLQSINTKKMVQMWQDMSLLSLPDQFNWENIAKRYQRKIISIIRESSELRQILDSQVQEEIAENIKSISSISPEFDLIKYQEGIQERYGNLKLDSLDTSGYAYNELKLWRMFIPQNVREVEQVLPQIHEIPKEYQQRLRESNELESELSPVEWEKYKQDYYRQQPSWIFEIWINKKNQRVVILGDPGSGKSTLLQYIALEWAESPIKDLTILPIPLLIELRTYIRNRDSGQCQDFLEFLHKGSGIVCRLDQHQLHEKLKAGDAVVMFDGLDEVFDPAKREEVITDIHRFTNDYSNAKVILTSRVIGYKPQRFKDAGFRHFMLQDLEQYQIDDFLHRWHDLTFNNEIEKIRKRDRLQIAINTSPTIRELAGNPLLLTMMAILNRNQELPRDRAELYNQASRVLLHQWDVERTLVEDHRLDPKTIDYKDKQAILRHVAYHLQSTEQGLAANLISANELESILSDYLKTIEMSQARTLAKLMLNQLRTRNFILCFWGADYYAFVHRTFLEYFCAWEFVWQFKETQTLSIEQLKTEIFGKHYKDDAWQEVLRLIAGMIEPVFVADIIESLIDQSGENENFINLFLADKILSEIRNRSLVSEVSSKLFKELQKLTRNQRIDETIRIKGVVAIANTWENNPEALLLFKDLSSSKSSTLSTEAIMAISKMSIENLDALSLLRSLAQSGNEMAIIQLAQISGNEPSTLNILQTLSKLNNEVAIIELARIGSYDLKSLHILKSILNSNINPNIKNIILEELIRYQKHDSELIVILKNLARSGNETALRKLISLWKYDPDTISIVKSLARSAHKVAIEELAFNWEDDPETFSILLNLAFSKENAKNIMPWNNKLLKTKSTRYDDINSINLMALTELFLLGKLDSDALNLFKMCYKLSQDISRENIIHDIERALSKLDKGENFQDIKNDLESIRQLRRGESHFSTLRTKITSAECLKKTLLSLGYKVKTESDVRASNGMRCRADVVAVLEGNCDLGWSQNTDQTFDLIGDLWGVAKKHNQTTLINSINKRYGSFQQGYRRFVD